MRQFRKLSQQLGGHFVSGCVFESVSFELPVERLWEEYDVRMRRAAWGYHLCLGTVVIEIPVTAIVVVVDQGCSPLVSLHHV